MPQNKSDILRERSSGKRNVLIVRFSAIGDVAMTIPAVYSVCRAYKHTRFYLVTRESMTAMFVNAPANLTVIGLDLKQQYKGLAGMRRIMRELIEQYHIDTIVDLHDVIRTKYMRLLGRLHGIPSARIDKGRSGKRQLTRRSNKVMLPLKSTRDRYRDTFVAAGLPFDESFVSLFDDGPAPAEAYQSICPAKPADERWIGIAPFAKHEGKIYPPLLMEQVVGTLSMYDGVRIFLFGGGDREKEILGSWAAKYPRVRSLAGERHGFGRELALISNLDCVVSMDSANMHLAAITGVPVISIWGATHPYCGFKGWRQDDDLVIQLPLTCRPCSVFGDKPCHRGDYLCLNGIRPQVIIDKVLSVLHLTRQITPDTTT